jgi:hypothetical protein
MDEPFDCVECLHDTKDYLTLKYRQMNEFFNPKDAEKAANTKICKMCFEFGATKRKCCNQLYCDHCYTKNQECPYCKASTRIEKMTGATFAVDSFSEHEECRCCLEPGTKRRCCGSYYCDDCYYKLPQCRSCEAPTGNKPSFSSAVRGSIISILLSWFTTALFVLGVVALVLVLSANEAQTRVLMSGYKCYGFFKDCQLDICAEMTEEVAMGTSAVPPLSSWRKCTLDSNVKLINKACIFDQQLYDSTEGFMGFDVCMDKFHQGVYIFEDTFEAYGNYSWQSNSMASANWHYIRNGFATSYCGVAEHLGEEKALTFSGVEDRFAETQDMDVSVGGWLEAEMFIAPIGFDVTNPNCKSSYAGSIDVEYSIDGGTDWYEMDHFDAWEFRQATFFPQQFPIAEGSRAATNATRFRFIQRSFTAARDAWALDNVRVLRFLPTDWAISEGFIQNVAYTVEWMQKAQCCFDTDWCETRLTEGEMDSCETEFEWYKGRNYFIRGAELYVVIVVFLNLFKWVYMSACDYLLRGRFPFQDEWEDLTKFDKVWQYLPKRYRPKKNIASLVGDIHQSARLAAELQDVFKDDEGEGELIKNQEDIDRERKAAKAQAKKAQKRLKERMKNKNFRSSALVAESGEDMAKLQRRADGESDSDSGDSEESEAGGEQKEGNLDSLGLDSELDQPAGGEGGGGPDAVKPKGSGADEMAEFKKTNVGMLRVPFDNKVSWPWINAFRNSVLGVFILLCLIKLGSTSYYVVHQPYIAFGLYPGKLSVTSMGLFFFAICCDGKEIYHVLRKVIPSREEWIPLVTVDLQEEVSSLFVGPHTIELKDISEITAFPDSFAMLCAAAYWVGTIPWCTLSIILRDQFLEFEAMRVVSPTLGCIMGIRAILGPGFLIKMAFSFYYLFALDPKVRERFGAALQQEKSASSGFWTGVSWSFLMWFVAAILLYELSDLIGQLGLLFGILYGVFTGCIHSLPIHPWMYLTIIRGGVWMRVKKKQRCPCIYWGSFCTEMHEIDQVFIIWTTDQVRFLSYLKGGVNGQSA